MARTGQATRDMFLDDQAIRTVKKSLTSPSGSGIREPWPASRCALEKCGTMPLNKVIRPAIKAGGEGFTVSDALADDLETYGSRSDPRTMPTAGLSSGKTASR